MTRSATDAALLDAVGHRLRLAGEPQLVNTHHADTYRWQQVAVRVAFDGSAAAIRQRNCSAAQSAVSVARVVALIEGDGCEALVVQWHDSDPGRADASALGAQLARLHQRPAPAFLPDLHTMLQRRWRNGPERPVRLPQLLQHTIRHADKVLEQVAALAPPVFLHGDLVPGNVLWSHSGPVLIDWELAAAGNAWWDLAHLQAHVERFGDTTIDMDHLIVGYGQDPRGDTVFTRLCRVRHAMNTISALYRAEADDTGAWATEAARRLAFWDGDERPWTDLPAPRLWR